MNNLEVKKILNINEFKKSENIETLELYNYYLDNNRLLLLFGTQVETGMIIKKSKVLLKIYDLKYDSNNSIISKAVQDHIINKQDNSYYIRPLGANILVYGCRALYKNKNFVENNLMIFSNKLIKEFCIGDGIENCVTTDDEKIVVAYMDEGIFGNSDEYGPQGIIVFDKNGETIWSNTQYEIHDCDALNLDKQDRIWFMSDPSQNFTCIDLNKEYDIDTNIYDFIFSNEPYKLILSSTYKENIFISYDYDYKTNTFSNKQKVTFKYNNNQFDIKEYQFCKTSIVFISTKDDLYYWT